MKLRVLFAVMLGCAMTCVAHALPASAMKTTNCAVELVPIGIDPSSGAIEAAEVDLGCYDTYAQAVAAGTDGATLLAAGARPATLTQRALQEATDPAASSV